MIAPWMQIAARKAEESFARHKVKLTLGGEPTFIPVSPVGAEWNFSAVGPTKLGYAQKFAVELRRKAMKGAAQFFCPGKLYPGEANPRWVVRLIANRDGKPLLSLPRKGVPITAVIARSFAVQMARHLGVRAHSTAFSDPTDKAAFVLALPLDHDGARWQSAPWKLEPAQRRLSEAEGPAGLRLPLHLMPEHMARRVFSIEKRGGTLRLFFPPLLQGPFLELLAAVQKSCRDLSVKDIELEGYTASDTSARWTILGLAADPGVLEINLPACQTWRKYAEWLETLEICAQKVGLRSWKQSEWDHPQGSGGGNHLLWGGPTLEENPFFTRPAWLAAILRYWQQHPALAYLFTGCYVGASSQAPRPDESARDLYDIEMAYTFLESLGEGDHRVLINETLRHIQTDVTGNSHRSEISFDKFWNPSLPSGALGLIEFRAIEAFPKAEWMSSIALLWISLAAHLLHAKPPEKVKRFGTKLLDEYFLPSCLWDDLEEILDELAAQGYLLDKAAYREIWDWRFPALLDWAEGAATICVRKALESWPLLCETPVEGGATSRFVDTSMQRLEIYASETFAQAYKISFAGRPLPLHERKGRFLGGLRYRRTNLYPSLHPGIPVQMPLVATITTRKSGKVVARFEMAISDLSFRSIPNSAPEAESRPCKPGKRGDITCDLRLA